MEQINNAVVIAAALAPIIAGIVQAIKKANYFNTKYLPIVALAVGFLVGLIIGLAFGLNVAELALSGLIAGLASSGLYDLGKGVTK